MSTDTTAEQVRRVAAALEDAQAAIPDMGTWDTARFIVANHGIRAKDTDR